MIGFKQANQPWSVVFELHVDGISPATFEVETDGRKIVFRTVHPVPDEAVNLFINLMAEVAGGQFFKTHSTFNDLVLATPEESMSLLDP